jgi:hypothetical protein
VHGADRTQCHLTSRPSDHRVPDVSLIIPGPLHQVSYSCLKSLIGSENLYSVALLLLLVATLPWIHASQSRPCRAGDHPRRPRCTDPHRCDEHLVAIPAAPHGRRPQSSTASAGHGHQPRSSATTVRCERQHRLSVVAARRERQPRPP